VSADAEVRIADLKRRVLGGYQLLQALVGIRLRAVTDPESRRHLTWLSDVAAALALMNRRVLEDGPVDFGGYLEDTAAFWRRACEGRPIRFDVRAAGDPLPESHAQSLAIIAHELIANAVRHAFPEGRRGSVAIAFSRSSSGVSLVVRDSGVGAAELPRGEGLALVEGLVQHLGGAMTVETAVEAGVGVRIRLPLTAVQTH
jgi:two-component sensor histidine kinase